MWLFRFGILPSLISNRPSFDTSFTGNSQTYSADEYSVTGSSTSVAPSIIKGYKKAGKYLLEIKMDEVIVDTSIVFGWIDYSQPNNFLRVQSDGWNEYPATPYETVCWTNPNTPPLNGGSWDNVATNDILSVGIDISANEIKAWINGAEAISSTLSASLLSTFQTNGFTLGFSIWDNNKYTLTDPSVYTYPNIYPGATLGWN